jgi:CRP-like cAMP-binding protein
MSKLEDCAKRLNKLFDPYLEIEIENWLNFTSKGQITHVKKNTIIKTSFTIEKHLNFIISGSGGILKWHENNFICLGLGFDGDFLCDYSSFLNQEESDLETLVFKDSVLFSINYQNFTQLLSSERGEKLRRKIAEGIMKSQQDSAKELLTKTASERYNDLLIKHPEILITTPSKYIASYLGITPQSLSRIRKNHKQLPNGNKNEYHVC